jgi:hypothetical protein
MGILKWDGVELESVRHLLFNKEQNSFLNFIDCFQSYSAASCSMVVSGRWELLFSILKALSNHYDANFHVYENPCGLLFDAAPKSIKYKDDDMEIETEIQRLKGRRDQIENEIVNLQKRHGEICERIKEKTGVLTGRVQC